MRYRGILSVSIVIMVLVLVGMLLGTTNVCINCMLPDVPGPDETGISRFSRDRLGVRGNTHPRSWATDKPITGIDAGNLTLNQLYPSLASDYNRSLYCTWQDVRTGDWDIFFSKSTNFGLAWSDNLLVTNASTSNGHQQFPKIVLGSRTEPVLYIVWQDMRNDDGDIYFSYSIDEGNSWANEIKINIISPLGTNQWYPDIAVDQNGYIYVVWADNSDVESDDIEDWNILLTKSMNKGITWSNPRLVNDPNTIAGGSNQTKPALSVSNDGMVYVAWEDDRLGDSQIFLSTSPNAGESFSKDFMVSVDRPSSAEKARQVNILAYENDVVFIAWAEDDNSKYNVFFSKSLDYGSSFSAPIQVNNVSDKCSPSANPVVEADEKGNIFVSWADQRAENHIYLAYSDDNGMSFKLNEKVDDADNTPANAISTTTKEQLERSQQVLARLLNKIYVFWTDYINDPNPDNFISENGDIYFDWNATLANQEPTKINFNTPVKVKGWSYINLSWPISKDIDFTNYLLYKSTITDYTPEPIFLNTTISDRHQNYLNFTGLTASTTYYFFLVVEDIGGLTNRSNQLGISTKANVPPAMGLVEPDGDRDLVDEAYEIIWWDNDPDDNASIKLYYDSNQNPIDGRTFITQISYGEDSGKDFYLWNTEDVPNGSYYISAVISDEINGEQYPVYSSGRVTIFHGNLDPLIILFKYPLNISDVDLTEGITVRFNKQIDLSTVHTDSFWVQDELGGKVNGEFTYNSTSNKLRFSPENDWNGSEKYTVFITKSIKDESGLFSLVQNYEFWFETEEYIIPNGTVYGVVLDKYYSDPIPDAQVILNKKGEVNNTLNTISDASGRFSYTVQYGIYELEVTAESYQDTPITEIIVDRISLDVSFELVRPVLIEFGMDTKIGIDAELDVNAVAIHPNNEPIQYIWDFGDGTIEVGQNISHKYSETGKYTVKLTVSDDNNGYITQTEIVEVIEGDEGSDYLMTFAIVITLVIIIALIIIATLMRAHREQKLKAARSRWDAEHDEELEEEEEETEPRTGRARLKTDEDEIEEEFEEAEEVEEVEEDIEAGEDIEAEEDLEDEEPEDDELLEDEDLEEELEEELVTDEEPEEVSDEDLERELLEEAEVKPEAEHETEPELESESDLDSEPEEEVITKPKSKAKQIQDTKKPGKKKKTTGPKSEITKQAKRRVKTSKSSKSHNIKKVKRSIKK
jgi:PKD repeat protein